MKFVLRAASVAATLVLVLFAISCGDSFRPVANPVVQPGGTAQPLRFAVVISQAAAGAAGGVCPPTDTSPACGAASNISVAGDTDVADTLVGRTPVHATFHLTLNRVFVANRDDDTVSFYSPTASFAQQTISLPELGSKPVFVHSVETGFMYVANSGTNKVDAINLGISPAAVTASIPVGTTPVALAETFDQSKLFVVNQGSNNVSVVDTSTKAVSRTVAVGASPAWAAASSDSAAVYVVNRDSNSLSVIATASAATSADATLATGAAPNFVASFVSADLATRRVFVTNSGGSSVSVYDATTTTAPTLLKEVAVRANPVSLAVLPDGSRAYVANSGAACVSVIDLSTLAETKCIPVGNAPGSIAGSADGSKVYVANSGSNSVSIIRTTDDASTASVDEKDTAIRTLPTPFNDFNCTAETANCKRNNPVFVVTSP